MMTKKIQVGIAVAALLVLPIAAQAADMPQPYVEPAYVAPFSWTGFYVGVNGGYGWGTSNWSGGAGTFKVTPEGFVGGATIGFNLQTGLWVWGVEGDLDYVDLYGASGAAAACVNCDVKDTWLGTLRGRIGYSFDRLLPYVTGGVAYGNLSTSTPGGTVDRTKAGWTAGAGVEYTFAGAWSAKFEWLYVDLGSATCSYSTCVLPTDATVDFMANILRLGVNYHF